MNDTHSKVIVKRPIAKRAGRSISECVPNIIQAGSSQMQTNFRKPAEPNQQQVEQTPNGKIPPGTHRIYDLYIYTWHVCRINGTILLQPKIMRLTINQSQKN